MAYLLISEQGKIKKFEITEDFVFIGRTPENQIRISDPNASRQHCQIIKVEGGLRLIDLGSQYGTRVGGQDVKQKDLAEKDVIQIGQVKIQVRDVGSVAAPAAKPAAAKPVVAVKPAGGSGAASRRSSRRKPELRVNPEVAKAAASGGRLVRKNPRKAARIPTWAMAVIVLSIFAVVAVIITVVIKTTASDYGDTFQQALNKWEKREYNEAIKLFESIPESDTVYGKKAREHVAEIKLQSNAGVGQRDSKNSIRQYANNIIQYIETFIDAPEGDEKRALHIKRNYGPDRPSYIRVLLVDRLEPYMERFPDTSHMTHVKELYAKYCKEVNPKAPPTFRDVQVQSGAFLRLKYYGKAYQCMAKWISANPGQGKQPDAEKFYGRIYSLVNSDWEFEEKYVIKNEKDGNPAYALKKLNRFLGLMDGYDRPEISGLRSKLMERKAENEARAGTISGVRR